MRIARNAVLAIMLCLMTACSLCPGKDTDPNTLTSSTKCDGKTCNLVVYISNCLPVDATKTTSLEHLNAEPGNIVCFFNDDASTHTLSIPTGLVKDPADAAAPDQTYTLAHGACVSIEIPSTAASTTKSYTISKEGCAASDGHGNPDVIVGGGG